MTDSKQTITELEGEAELARPYARAVFKLAKDKDQFQAWSDSLALMAAVVSNDSMRSLLDNPGLSRSEAAALVIRACGEDLEERIASYKAMLTIE